MGRRDETGKLQPTPEVQVLKLGQAIRSRPHLYVETPRSREAIANYVLGACCWGVDEIVAGRASILQLRLLDDGALVIKDDGDGMPVAPGDYDGTPACEVIMTALLGCRDAKRDDDAKSICETAMSMAVVNAFSKRCELKLWRDGYHFCQDFEEGAPLTPLRKLDPTEETGTQLTLYPDRSILRTSLTQEILFEQSKKLSESSPSGNFQVVGASG